MMWIWGVIFYCAFVVMFVIGWAALFQLGRARKEEQRAIELQMEAIECADLLRVIAVMSYMQHHRDTHQAWADTMGNIQIQVKAQPHRIDGDE